MNHGNLILIILLHLFNISQTLACDCLDIGTLKSEVKRSSIVALVKTISCDSTQFIDEYGHLDAKSNYKFLVLKKYKGTITSDTIYVSTPYEETACGVIFEIDREYIVYGNQWTRVKRKPVRMPENYYQTNSCTRTKEFDANEEAAIIEALK